jgi:hypothetical protein
MNANFSTKFSSKTEANCEQTSSQTIQADRLVIENANGVKIGNVANAKIKCGLEKASAQDLQSNIVNSLTAAIEKNIDEAILKQLDQKAKSELGSIGGDQDISTTTKLDNTTINNIRNKINLEVKTELSDETLLSAKATALQDIRFDEGITITNSSNIEITNVAESFLDSQIVSKIVNNIVNKLVDSEIVSEHLGIKTTDSVETTQVAETTGFGALFESIGKMVGNIFGGLASGAMTPFMIIIGIIIVFMVLFKWMGSSQPQPQPQPQPQQYMQYPYYPPPPYYLPQQPPQYQQ